MCGTVGSVYGVAAIHPGGDQVADWLLQPGPQQGAGHHSRVIRVPAGRGRLGDDIVDLFISITVAPYT